MAEYNTTPDILDIIKRLQDRVDRLEKSNQLDNSAVQLTDGSFVSLGEIADRTGDVAILSDGWYSQAKPDFVSFTSHNGWRYAADGPELTVDLPYGRCMVEVGCDLSIFENTEARAGFRMTRVGGGGARGPFSDEAVALSYYGSATFSMNLASSFAVRVTSVPTGTWLFEMAYFWTSDVSSSSNWSGRSIKVLPY